MSFLAKPFISTEIFFLQGRTLVGRAAVARTGEHSAKGRRAARRNAPAAALFCAMWSHRKFAAVSGHDAVLRGYFGFLFSILHF